MNKILFIDTEKMSGKAEKLDSFEVESMLPDDRRLFHFIETDCRLVAININTVKEAYHLAKQIRKVLPGKQIKIILYSESFSTIAEMKSGLYSADAYCTKNDLNGSYLGKILSSETSTSDKTGTDKIITSGSSAGYNRIIINDRLLHLLMNPADIDNSIFRIMELLPLVCNCDISVIIVNFCEISRAYIKTFNINDKNTFRDFFKFCQHDHFSNFSHVDINSIEKIFSDKIEGSFSKKTKFEKNLINSYFYLPVKNFRELPVATIHIGNFSNNYFSNKKITDNLKFFAEKSGIIIDTVNKIYFAEKNRREIKNLFSKFVPVEIIDELISAGSNRRKNERKKIAVLFSDIRSFTTITEENDADTVINFLNIYFDEMVKCIKKYSGTIDKFIGDAIVAVFGINENPGNTADNALMAASEMISMQRLLNTGGIKLPETGFEIGIGIHYGESIVGNIGSDEKTAYTIVGKISGIAEELEGLTKNTAAILFSHQMKEELENLKDEAVELPDVNSENFRVYTTKNEFEFQKKNGRI
ncbi:MAG: adenylate/guanylate cyclase domain-containing protein [Spirochaetes bacterium]|nr:adenylate/guanylate cyclase domain-containing protein [Spirochaetota bacterium]